MIFDPKKIYYLTIWQTLRTGREGWGEDMLRCPNQRRRRCRRRDDAIGCLVRSRIADVLLPEHTQEAPLTAHVDHV